MPREAGRNPSFSDPSILLPKHRDVPFPLGPRRVPSTGPFPSQPPRGRLGAGAADQAENLVQHISGKGWQNRSPASPTGHIPSLEAFPKEYLRIPLHRDAVLRATVILADLCIRFLSVPSSRWRIPIRVSPFRQI
jgi:hypothetical protein